MILNLGAGKKTDYKAVNVDIMPWLGVDKIVDLSLYPWPWADNSVEGIHASHIIEHFPDQKQFIAECLRILKNSSATCFLYNIRRLYWALQDLWF